MTIIFKYLKEYYIRAASIIRNDSTVLSFLWQCSANNGQVTRRCLTNVIVCNIFRKDVNKFRNQLDDLGKIKVLDSTMSSPHSSSTWSSTKPSSTSSSVIRIYVWVICKLFEIRLNFMLGVTYRWLFVFFWDITTLLPREWISEE